MALNGVESRPGYSWTRGDVPARAPDPHTPRKAAPFTPSEVEGGPHTSSFKSSRMPLNVPSADSMVTATSVVPSATRS
jgi:hypothetical protein